MFNFFKKQPVKEVIVESPEDIIPPQVKSDMEYIKRIYDQLGIMWDNGDKRVEKDEDSWISGTYRYYKDSYIMIQINSIDTDSRIVITGYVNVDNEITRTIIICNTSVYHQNVFDRGLYEYSPIEWEVSSECKANVLKHIEENILNTTQYESLQAQFCRKLSNKE